LTCAFPSFLGCFVKIWFVFCIYIGIYKIRIDFYLFVFIFRRNPAFSQISGIFISFPLVYTGIIEQKRIGGQEQILIF